LLEAPLSATDTALMGRSSVGLSSVLLATGIQSPLNNASPSRIAVRSDGAFLAAVVGSSVVVYELPFGDVFRTFSIGGVATDIAFAGDDVWSLSAAGTKRSQLSTAITTTIATFDDGALTAVGARAAVLDDSGSLHVIDGNLVRPAFLVFGENAVEACAPRASMAETAQGLLVVASCGDTVTVLRVDANITLLADIEAHNVAGLGVNGVGIGVLEKSGGASTFRLLTLE
jgi:hypothetical protein